MTAPRASDALDRGRRALARLATPELIVASRDGMQTFDSPLVAALVVLSLVDEPDAAWRSLGEPYRRFLLDTVQPSGLWSLSNEHRLLLPAHASASAAALAALALWGGGEDNDLRAGLAAIRRFSAADGGVPTWCTEGNPVAAGEPSRSDLSATASLLLLAALAGEPVPGAVELVSDSLLHNGLNCLAPGGEAHTPLFFAHTLCRWLSRQEGEGAPAGLIDCVVWDCDWRREEAAANPLECALALVCLLDLGPRSRHPEWDQELDEMAARLVASQSEVGLWPPNPLWVDVRGHAFGSIQATSAWCLEALRKYCRAGLARRPKRVESSGGRPRRHPWRCSRSGPDSERSPRPGTLLDTLRSGARYLDPCLVPPPAAARLEAIARWIPGAVSSGFGIEVRLAKGGQCDFLVCVSEDGEDGRQILAGLSDDVELADDLRSAEAWCRVQAFCRQWSEAGGTLQRSVADFWLEFDLAGPAPPLPVPSVFFCLRELGMPSEERRGREAVQSLLEICRTGLSALWGHQLSPGLLRNLEACLESIPPGGYPFAVGAMLARRADALRFCVKGVGHDQLPGYLRRIRWPGPEDRALAVIEEIGPLVDRMHLAVDFGDLMLPSIGFELSYDDHRQPAEEPRWRTLIDHLVERGLCEPGKGQALLAWPGKFHCVEELEGGWISESYYRRILGHLKLGLKPGQRELEAKGYFGAWRAYERTGTRGGA